MKSYEKGLCKECYKSVTDRLDEFIEIIRESPYKILIIMKDELDKEIRLSLTAQAEGYEKA